MSSLIQFYLCLFYVFPYIFFFIVLSDALRVENDQTSGPQTFR